LKKKRKGERKREVSPAAHPFFPAAQLPPRPSWAGTFPRRPISHSPLFSLRAALLSLFPAAQQPAGPSQASRASSLSFSLCQPGPACRCFFPHPLTQRALFLSVSGGRARTSALLLPRTTGRPRTPASPRARPARRGRPAALQIESPKPPKTLTLNPTAPLNP
jgi:hypothetical protein